MNKNSSQKPRKKLLGKYRIRWDKHLSQEEIDDGISEKSGYGTVQRIYSKYEYTKLLKLVDELNSRFKSHERTYCLEKV